jgi:hypothetical protein
MARAFSGSLKLVKGSFKNTPWGVRGLMVGETAAMAITTPVYGNATGNRE